MITNRLRNFIGGLLIVALAWNATAQNVSWCGPNGCVPRTQPSSSRPLSSLPPEVSSALKSIVRVRHSTIKGVSLGTATLIANRNGKSYFITCAHLFDDGRGDTSIRVEGNAALSGKVIEVDHQHDLALLETDFVQQKPIPLEYQIGNQPLIAAGFGGNGKLRAIQGGVTGYATPIGASLPSLRIRGSVRPGDSGGPVLNRTGKLVAVLWGERGGDTFATFGKPILAILNKLPKEVAPIEQPQPRLPSWLPSPELTKPILPEVSPAQNPLSEQPKTNKEPIVPNQPSFLQRITGTWKTGQFLLGALSVGGPVGFAGALLFLRMKKQARRVNPIAIDSRPPPQQVVPETHYVSYENDEFAKAHQWACEQLARKFPGSVEILTSLDSLIRQQLAGRRDQS